MDKNESAAHLNLSNSKKKLLKDQVKTIFITQNLDNQRRLIKAVAAELKISVLDCAAALTLLNEGVQLKGAEKTRNTPVSVAQPHPPVSAAPSVKLVRYRLDIGARHQLNLNELKKVLVEESGVDIKNIVNVRIQETYTLIDLPDEMPQEIFHHLKTVEINGQKLDIRRVKPRNKKRQNRRFRHPQSLSRIIPNEINQ